MELFLIIILLVVNEYLLFGSLNVFKRSNFQVFSRDYIKESIFLQYLVIHILHVQEVLTNFI